MKKVLTKIGYMAFGSLLTLIGYHFGNIDNNAANAQQALEKTDNIVNKIRVRQLEIVGNDNSPRIYLGTNLDKGQIVVVDDNDVPHLTLKTDSKSGRIEVKDSLGKDRIKLGVSEKESGHISVLNSNAKTVVMISGLGDNGDGGFVAVGSGDANDNGNGFSDARVVLSVVNGESVIFGSSKTGKNYYNLGAREGKAFIQVMDEKNLRTILDERSMTIWNQETDQPILRSGVTGSGEGYISIFDKNGVPAKGIVGTGESTGKSTQIIEYEETIRRSVPIRPLRVVPRR